MTDRMALSLTESALLSADDANDDNHVANASTSPSFEAVYKQNFRGIWRTLRRLGVADAQLDDAAQDVFIVVHKKLRTFRGGSLRAWLYAIAVRVASDYRRGAARQRTTDLSAATTIADARPDPSQHSESAQSVRLLHDLLNRLDDKKRAVFVLSELEQLTVPEIAQALNINVNTAYSRQRAARQQFEAALQRHRRSEGPR